MTDARSLSKEEIAREIKEIFSYIKSSNRDIDVLANACRRLRNKSEAGYRGLIRLLKKYGYMNVIQEIASSVQSDTDTSSCTFGPDELLIQTPSPNPETKIKVNSSRPSNLGLPQQYIPTEPTGRTAERRVSGQYIDSNIDSDNPGGGYSRQDHRKKSFANRQGTTTGQYIDSNIDSDNPGGEGSVSEQYIGSGTPDRTTERRASLTDREQQLEQSKSERYARTKLFLSKTGLLGIADTTKDLLKKNRQLQKDIDSLKQQTEAFAQSVLSNQQNRGLLKQNQSPTPNIQQLCNTTSSVATPIFACTSGPVMSQADSTEFASILSGIYDFELPSVILAPVAVEQVFSHDQLPSAEGQLNQSTPSSPPRKRMKRYTE